MRHASTVALLLFLSASAGADDLLGFDTAGSEAQRKLESEFDSGLSPDDMDSWLRRLSEYPHHVGSDAGRRVVDFMVSLFESWGYDVEIAEYDILFPSPVTREVELVSPTRYTASLTEDAVAGDASTSRRDDLLPPYNAFSIDGEVEAELVFVNYGMPEDYDLLERHGVSVAGKIAIAKYGRSWRGIKPKLAGEKGALATLIYSDPADDGYGLGKTYPEGPYKHESGVQRGSVMDMPTYPGDVLTPGIGATERARRLNRRNAPTLTKIPVLPISYRDAEPLLAAMGGAVVPPEWRGGLPITYHLGPGPARVRMKLEFDWQRVPAYNVIARLEGSEFPDEWVVRGNHHDGWNHGAADPVSGLVALLNEARSVAALAAEGKPPKRTVIYAAWDAEEPGLIGSTEWVEHHARDLDQHAVAYLNTDGNSRGYVNIGGSHTLERFFNQIMEEVEDPRLGISVKDRRRAYLEVNAEGPQAKADATRRDLRISPLGSGSDYTPFLQHLGIASANFSFGGEGQGGSYHTLYDTYEHFTTWRDPELIYGEALAQVVGRATLRLANAPRLPFEFSGFADNVALYVDELETLADDMREETALTNRRLDDGTWAATTNPYEMLGPPKRQEPVPHFNFAPLRNAVTRLEEAAAAYDEIAASGSPADPDINRMLFETERLMTRDEGLPGRSWYKHHIYAPGFYTGYGVKTLPGVREAIEQRDYFSVAGQIEIVADLLNGLASHIEEIVVRESES